MATLAENLAEVQERMARAAARAGRDPAEITLIAVSKTQPVEMIAALAALGQADFGENRCEEAAPKMAAQPHLRWHMIGHVQSRKARDVAQSRFVLVHSVDSVKLAERLNRFCAEAGCTQAVLLECNVSGEATKAGFDGHDPAEWGRLLEQFAQIAALPHLAVRGLMTMAPYGTDHETARPVFQRLRQLRAAARAQLSRADWAALSMGMTDDFEGAIAEGATLIRVGRAIFGERA